MNMGFMKIVYVLTLLIIVMIINYHKSNANCKYDLYIYYKLEQSKLSI